MRFILLTFSCIALLAFVLPTILYAYIDPGTGSFFLQIVIAGFVGILVVIKTYFSKIKGFFMKKPKDGNSELNDN